MKKFMAILLVLALASLMGLSAMADPITELGGSDSKAVTANYVEETVVNTYKVTVTWGSLAFTYSAGKKTWDPDNHAYVEDEAAGWSFAEGANIITVTNDSDVAVDAALAFGTSQIDGVSLTGNTTKTVSAWNTTAGSATFTVGVSGTPTSAFADETTIATATVTISAAAD